MKLAAYLEELNLTHVDEIKLVNGEDTVEIKLSLPVDGVYVSYEEVFAYGKDTPDYLREATTLFVDALLRATKEQVQRKQEPPCVTCIGACCMDPTGEVRLTTADVDRLSETYGEEWLNSHVTPYGETAWTGYSAFMNRTELEWMDGRVGCVNLHHDGCAIYADRPQVCRDFSPWTCGTTYEEDKSKKAGLVQLRVKEKNDG